ncbi:type II toxin-antitoxin system RelE/ParE family toxin [Pseudomonas corrugata]
MIKSFQHKGLRIFYETGSTRGIRADHGKRLARMLQFMDRATAPNDLVSCFANTFFFDEWLLSSGKAPRRVIAPLWRGTATQHDGNRHRQKKQYL